MAETLNQRWSATIVKGLLDAGITDVVVCPGSRSTPLTLAFAATPRLKCWSILDERSGAFFALGLAKASGRPAAVVCTSGTAGAHFLPAVIEAAEGGTPLVVITADRPWVLHGFGAPQTIDQTSLYGPFVRRAALLPDPEDGAAAASHLQNVITNTLVGATALPPGAVHINAQFREPLSPPEGMELPRVKSSGARHFRPVNLPDPEALKLAAEAVNRYDRGVIVVGPRERNDGFPEAVNALGRRIGYPVLAESASNARFGFPNSISYYDALLRHQPFAAAVRPDVVLRFGGGLTPKAPQEWIDASGARTFLFSDDGLLFDPNHAADAVIVGDAERACSDLCGQVDDRSTSDYLKIFQKANAAAHEAWQEGDQSLTEPSVARTLGKTLPPDTTLFVGNSMPVRDLDAFAWADRSRLRVLCNRGVNGIDGVTSTALGAAAATGKPVCLFIGDLSLLHDLSGLIVAKRLQLSLTVVVVNNRGGGIFNFLPVAAQAEHFEHYFATPHEADFAAVANLAGARYANPKSVDELTGEIECGIRGGLHIIEVKTERLENVEVHREMFSKVAASLGGGPWV